MMEQFDQRCSTIGEHARGLAQRKFNELETLEINECRNPRGSAERAMKWVEQSQKALELIFLAQSCRVLGCHVRANLPFDREILRTRIADAKNEIRAAVDQLVALQYSYHDKVVKTLNPSGKWWKPFHSDHSTKAERAFARANITATELMQHLDTQAVQASQFAERFDELATSGLTLDLRFDDKGEIQILSASSAST